ncbi:MAG: DegT/DnrJ/EryC1/StrS family aminotransferase [Flavobacteriaceae bacterium]|nr:DegT/DnrJ/EryC1/StrS family aminotransferase [Flavobacteriaceae bacterium]
MSSIQMVDLKSQYLKIKEEVDKAVIDCMESSAFINGYAVKDFQKNLEKYQDVKYVVPCANGTDALQIALMALGLKAGDEVICPAFTYVATAEVIGLLGLKPVMIDVDENTFNMTVEGLEKVITPKTKVIVPVHLYGQSCDMEPILKFAQKHNLFVVEDNAQALGATYTFSDGTQKKTGTMGDIGCTSFFPSKNLGCFGDGGAIMTNNEELAEKLKMVANHGQIKKYHHEVLGCNSRLDTIQAVILDIKLKYLDTYSANRNKMADVYYEKLGGIKGLQLPKKQENSTHVFHQYTMRVLNGKRDELQAFLKEKGIPSMIYYPLPLYKQNAFKQYVSEGFSLPNTEKLCAEVLSLPIHTEKNDEHMEVICNAVLEFFCGKIVSTFHS